MWKHTAVPELPQMTIWRVGNACWVIMLTDTHSEYVILVLSRQQWLQIRASMLRSQVKASRPLTPFSIIT